MEKKTPLILQTIVSAPVKRAKGSEFCVACSNQLAAMRMRRPDPPSLCSTCRKDLEWKLSCPKCNPKNCAYCTSPFEKKK